MAEPKEEEERETLERLIKLDMGSGVSPEVQMAAKKALRPPMDMKKKQLPRAEVTMGDPSRTWDPEQGVEITDSRYGKTAEEVDETAEEVARSGFSARGDTEEARVRLMKQFPELGHDGVHFLAQAIRNNNPHIKLSPALDKAVREYETNRQAWNDSSVLGSDVKRVESDLEELEKERESKPKSRLPRPRY
mgnify:CR=1 FL=1|tara:strand:- start:71 stop:643 length:573 start_codon:yes stop_codon:yes gene_type:complete